MSLETANLITYVTGFTVGALLIVYGLLQSFGVDWVARRRGPGRPIPVRNSMLAGVGMCLMTAGRIPVGHRSLWDLLLTLPGTVMFVWGMYLIARSLQDREAH